MPLVFACVMTVVIETVFFRICGFKSWNDLAIIALSNFVTNIPLNLLIMFFPDLYDLPWLLILELAVVAAEYLIYRRAFGKMRFLLLFTFIANVLSFFIGLVLQEMILY